MANKYKFFIFLPLSAIAVFYLVGITDISYIFNTPMVMSPVSTKMPIPLQIFRTKGKIASRSNLKINSQDSNKFNFRYCVSCIECRNIPSSHNPVVFYYGKVIKTISSKKKFLVNRYSSDIPHPPQNYYAV
ncbi:MAG: hypothetical protein M0034_06820 [Deltaproteobacteria bacterium]|nr:hypothetical protein [Deltaproteobacteria bacterium]